MLRPLDRSVVHVAQERHPHRAAELLLDPLLRHEDQDCVPQGGGLHGGVDLAVKVGDAEKLAALHDLGSVAVLFVGELNAAGFY